MEFDTNIFRADRLEFPPRPHTELWHPRLTPYRFLVLFTTIGLGSVKAYAVSQNLYLVATSIEWVTGVLVFSILFILGLFESEPTPPRLLKWLLIPDLVHTFFRMLSWNPPRYRSDELKNPVYAHEYQHLNAPKFPPITGYRLLTSISVALFGIFKAYFTTQNTPFAANAFDWSLGIIVTSFLYTLGLYENNPLNLMPYLFAANYSVIIYYILWLAMHIIGITSISLASTWIWSYMPTPQPLLVLSALNTSERLQDLGWSLLLLACFLILPFAVIIMSFRVLEFFWNHSPNLDIRIRRRLQVICVWPWWWIQRPPGFSFVNGLRRVRRNGIWILFCIFGLVLFAAFALLSLSALLVQFSVPGSPREGVQLLIFYSAKLCLVLSLAAYTLFSFGMCVFYLVACLACLLVNIQK